MTLGERIVRNDEVVGSIPTGSTKFSEHFRREGVSPIPCCVVVCGLCRNYQFHPLKLGHPARGLPRGNRRVTTGKVGS